MHSELKHTLVDAQKSSRTLITHKHTHTHTFTHSLEESLVFLIAVGKKKSLVTWNLVRLERHLAQLSNKVCLGFIQCGKILMFHLLWFVCNLTSDCQFLIKTIHKKCARIHSKWCLFGVYDWYTYSIYWSWCDWHLVWLYSESNKFFEDPNKTNSCNQALEINEWFSRRGTSTKRLIQDNILIIFCGVATNIFSFAFRSRVEWVHVQGTLNFFHVHKSVAKDTKTVHTTIPFDKKMRALWTLDSNPIKKMSPSAMLHFEL